MGRFVNTDLRKDIRDILIKYGCLYAQKDVLENGKVVENKELVDDIERFFEKWYDMRISACFA